MFIQFQYLLLSSVITSMSLYLNISSGQINNKNSNMNSFLDKLIKVSTINILFCVILILVGILKGILFVKIPLPSPFLQIGVICLIAMAGLAFYQIIKNTMYSAFTSAKTKLIFFIFCSLLVTISDYQVLYYIVLPIFTVIYIKFAYIICNELKIRNNVGMTYMTLSVILLILFSVAFYFHNEYFFGTVLLCLICMILFGYFLFYLSYFANRITKQMNQLKNQDEVIKKKNETLDLMAFTDMITNLPNRVAFEKTLQDCKNPVYLGLLNIHGFMNYNNLLGFERGNQILKDLADTLTSIDSQDIKAFRFYSDKFLLILNSPQKQVAYTKINTILNKLEKETFQGITLTAYFGLYKPDNCAQVHTDFSSILSALEIASVLAKETQRSIYEYAPHDHKIRNDQTNLELALKNAIRDSAFTIYYQPQVDSNKHLIRSYEALIRWKHEDIFIPPSVFIPLSEKLGLISDITRQVVEMVFSDIKKQPVFLNKRVAINLSADQLIEKNFLDFVITMVKKYGVDPKFIVFEITETSLFNDVEKVNTTIRKLKALNFQISLDDFGNGYSSLFRFSNLDIDEIKFDKSFVENLDNPKVYDTMKKTSELFSKFNMRIVVEGIETESELKRLQDIHIDLFQGYHFYYPLPLEVLKGKVVGQIG